MEMSFVRLSFDVEQDSEGVVYYRWQPWFYMSKLWFFVCKKLGELVISHRRRYWSYLIIRWLSVLGCKWWFMMVKVLQWILDGMGGVYLQTLRHLSQHSVRVRVGVWKRLYLGGCEEPPIVRHTCDRRLRNREKCNHRWDIHGNVGKETLPNVAGCLNYSPLFRAPPS